MSIENLINLIIPPRNYASRNGFDNIPILKKIPAAEKNQVEDYLINMLLSDEKLRKDDVDMLIVDTLAYLKSKKAVNILNQMLLDAKTPILKLKIAACIFEISPQPRMIEIAVNAVSLIDDKKDAYYSFKLIDAFYYLKKFNHAETKKIIESYLSHADSNISYNAKRILGM